MNRDPNRYLTGIDDQRLIPRWQGIVSRFREELLNLNIDRQVMASAIAVFNANQRLLQHPGRFRFLDAIWRWHGVAMALAVRRQLDSDRRSASLRVFLAELRARPGAYRVETLRQLFPQAADNAIASLGRSLKRSGEIDVAQVDRDIAAMDGIDREIGDYVDRHVAHSNFDPSRDVEAPRYLDLNDAFVELERIAGKYSALFFSGSMPFNPNIPGEWIDVFEFPWRNRRPLPDATESREYLVNVDIVFDETTSRDWHQDDSAEHGRDRRNREFLALIEQARSLEVGSDFCEHPIPEAIRVERLA
jgi:AbiU2